jgi:preprotein translocase SecA subunit
MLNAIKKLFGDTDEKVRRRYRSQVEAINSLEEAYQQLTNAQLRAKTGEFRRRLAQGETLDDLLPEAFATVREAARRTIGMRHYDVQLIGGMVLHEGKIGEMKTGEGKTLVATLPLYLNALAGQGCHLVTVNDYLARRDAGWMGPVYHLLDMQVGFVAHDYSARFDPEYVDPDAPLDDERLVHWKPCTRQEAYAADITYGTNNEFGFDYLRDNMVNSMEQVRQRGHYYAIVDEVDNILIDEARTPLIISGPAQQSSSQYARFAQLVRPLRAGRVTPDEVKKGAEPDGDVLIDPKTRSAVITESGMEKIEIQLDELGEGESVYDPQHATLTHYLENALKAQFVFFRDKDYVVQDGEVIIVDEFTGRLMPGRRWSDGLHQAVEAKEGVEVRRENVTYATITFQNYFRKYTKLSGMTGTAVTEKEEFQKFYNAEVTAVPTNKPVIRLDYSDQIYPTEEAKFRALLTEMRERTEQGQPILVGTTSVETSERLSALLKREKIRHQVLNAKQNVDEARVIAQAGQPGTVTIATNMAGRGTDILLGGNPEALAARHLEERGVTHEQITELAESLLADPKTQKSAPEQIVARSGNDMDADLLAALRQLHAEYEQALERIEAEGMQLFVIHTVLGDAPEQFDQHMALVDAVLNGRLLEVRNMLREFDWVGEEHISEIRRLVGDMQDYRNRHGRERAVFLAERLFKRVYTSRAKLVQLVLRGELERARAYVEQEPGLQPGYIDEVLQIQQDCLTWREQIKEAGGLHIIGTERHESRRIDNQLRGRAGRQGDPGSSTFYLSLEDDLMRRFGRMDTVKKAMERLGGGEDMKIEAGLINRSIESAQTRVEGFNFDMRKHTVEYDDVMNKQREVIYGLRRRILEEADEQRQIGELVSRYLDPERQLRRIREDLRETAELPEDAAHDRVSQLLPDVEFDLAELRAADDETLTEILEPLIAEQRQRGLDDLLAELEAYVELPEDAGEQLRNASPAEAEQYLNRLWREQTSGDLEERIKDLFADEFARLVERYLENYDDWVRGQIQEAIADATNPATDEVNIRLVQRRLLGILPEMRDLDLVELAELSDNQVQRRLETLIIPSREQGHHIDLLVREIFSLVPSLLPGPQHVIWLNVPTNIREQIREDYIKQYTAALDRMTESMAAEEREQLRRDMAEFIREQLRPLFNPAARITQAERQEMLNALSARSVELLRTVLGELDIDAVEEMLNDQVARALDDWRTAIGVQDLGRYQRSLMLQTIDQEWQQYLTAMEDLRQGIGLQAIGQRDPLVQYQTAGYRMFQELLDNIDQNVVRNFFRQLPAYRQQIANYQTEQARREQATRSGYELTQGNRPTQKTRGQTLRRKLPKVGRNDPCPCGSGKKYKYCHGRTEAAGETADALVAEGDSTAAAASPAMVGQETAAQPAAKGRSVPAEQGGQKPARGRATPSSGQSSPQRGRKVTKK